ncbi:unnamed protein product [Strongylus vulgaris]|uniref:Uncharacterized protein n=1 Tax=Strongylus vulgaris TaxID=40348 RepID=A0A3P7J7N0_STRVU|nr:unnamed protein product [Strongylus vulgaris]
MSRFEGKVVIVTGSSSGIGAETARLFAKEGAKVTITGRNQDGLEATKQSIISAGGKDDNINVVNADITDAMGREQIVNSTVEKWGQIDILVNNAGGGINDEKGQGGISANLDILKKTMELNVYSVVHMVQLARPHLAKTKGEVVNISSIAGQPKGAPRYVYYAMAKAALDQLTRGLAVELIAEGVRVNSVSPGAVVTKFPQHAGMTDEEAAEATKQSIISAGGKDDNINVVNADITDAMGRERIVNSTVEKWGQIDILVNNAGGGINDEKGQGGISADLDILKKTMELNVYRFVYYAMAKAALDQLTRGLAVELIAEGVRVNSVSPGAVVTKFPQHAGMTDDEAAEFYKRFASSENSLPIREIGQPVDIANVIAFLADRKASRYILGQTLIADGENSLPIREIGQPVDIANVIAFLADRKASRYILGQTLVADGGTMLITASNAAVFK